MVLIAPYDPDWEARVCRSSDDIGDLLRAKTPLMAHALLRPFFEAHQIVADVLCASASDVDDETLTRRALGVGRQYAAQNLIRGTESASTPLFATTRQVANDQGLLQDGDDLQGRRAAHLAEITGILGDLDRIEQCWLAQR